MKRALVLLGAGLVALLAAERALTRAAQAERAARQRVAPLLSGEERAALRVAALRIETSGGASWRYARLEGSWRCLDLFGAPADGAGLARLVEGFSAGVGELVSAAPSEAQAFGIGTGETLRVALLGPAALTDPSGDELVAFDVGRRALGLESAYVRRRGTREVRLVDFDPRALLDERAAPDLPPLLERALVPASWPGWQSGLERVFVDRAGGSGYELARRAAAAPEAALAQGRLPWEWVLDPGPRETRTAEAPAAGYALFLQHAHFVAVLDPARRVELGLETPAARVTLAAADGTALELGLGVPLADGRVPAWNGHSASLFLVEPEVAGLLAPERALLAEGSRENPFDPWLRADPGSPGPIGRR